MKTAHNVITTVRATPRLSERLIQRALLLTSQVLGRMIDEADCLTPEGTHSVRVAIKRLRAGWRLLRPVLPAEVPAAAEARVRALHHALAADRARHVRLATIERLRSAADSSELQAHWLTVAAAVQDDAGAAARQRYAPPRGPSISPAQSNADELADSGSATTTELIGRTFRAESRAWRELNAQVVCTDLMPELRKSYRRAKRTAKAIEARDPGSYHVWRLRLKRLLHQLELLGIAEAVPAELRNQWVDTAAQLGRFQDLHEFASHAASLRLPDDVVALIKQRVHADQRHLQRRLRRRSEEAFAMSSRAFVNLLRHGSVTA